MSKYTDEDMFRDRTTDAQIERKAQRARQREEQQELTRQQKRIRRRRRGALIWVLCIAAVMVAAVVTAINTMGIFQLQEEKKRADEQLAELEYQRTGLEQELEIVESDEYVEQQARSELRMIYDGEVLYVVRDEEKNEPAPDEMPEQVKP